MNFCKHRPPGDPMVKTANDTYMLEDFTRICRFLADAGMATKRLKWSLAQLALVQVTILLLQFCVGWHNDCRIMHTCDIWPPYEAAGCWTLPSIQNWDGNVQRKNTTGNFRNYLAMLMFN